MGGLAFFLSQRYTKRQSRHLFRRATEIWYSVGRAALVVMGGHKHAVVHGAVCLHAASLDRALIRAPQDRAAASDTLVRHFGGRLIGLYYTPGGEYDGFALFEAPDDAAAAAAEIADVALGHLRSNRLLRVLSAEEMRAAL